MINTTIEQSTKQRVQLDYEDILRILANYFDVTIADVDLYSFVEGYGYSCAATIENVEVD